MRTLLIALLALVATATTTLTHAPPAHAAQAPAAPARASQAPTLLEAGTPLTTSTGWRCVNGFNADGYLLIPADCAREGTTVHGPGGGAIGPVVATRTLYSVVRVVDPTLWDQVPYVAGISTPIQGSMEVGVGSTVCVAHRPSGYRCGTVQAKNVTVTWPQGTFHGLTRTSICPEPGDHWAAVFSGNQAQGHMVGASGCSTYFHPINRILSAEGLRLTG